MSNPNSEPVSKEEQKRRQDLGTRKMGVLLLKGWRMLDKHCPDCFVPYMDDKKGIVIC